MAEPLRYEGVTTGQLGMLRAALEKHGFDISGNHAEIKKMGADVVADYNPETQVLTIEIRKSPWVVSRERFARMIQGEIDTALCVERTVPDGGTEG